MLIDIKHCSSDVSCVKSVICAQQHKIARGLAQHTTLDTHRCTACALSAPAGRLPAKLSNNDCQTPDFYLATGSQRSETAPERAAAGVVSRLLQQGLATALVLRCDRLSVLGKQRMQQANSAAWCAALKWRSCCSNLCLRNQQQHSGQYWPAAAAG